MTTHRLVTARRPLCYECLTENVAVKVTDQCGFEHWFCQADWDANERLRAKLMAMFEDAVAEQPS